MKYKYKLIVRGRPKIEKLDKFLDSVNKDIKELAVGRLAYNVKFLEGTLTVDKEMTLEEKIKVIDITKKEIQKKTNFTDITVEVVS